MENTITIKLKVSYKKVKTAIGLVDGNPLTNKEIDKLFFNKDIVVHPEVTHLKDIFLLHAIRSSKLILKAIRKK